MTDLTLEAIAQQAPEVSFIQDYPGAVKSGIGREANSLFVRIVSWILVLIGPLVYIPTLEAGERHLFFATSAKYPPRSEAETGDGVPVPSGVGVADGIDGEPGSGVYSVHCDGESVGSKVMQILRGLREEGLSQRVWDHTRAEFRRITGSEVLRDE